MLKKLISLISCLLLMAGCLPPGRGVDSPWLYSDLRLLDAVDSALPDQDFIAAYARQAGADIEVRIDVLDGLSPRSFDLYLVIDTTAGGIQDLPVDSQSEIAWDVLVQSNAGQLTQALDAGGARITNVSARMYQDELQDSVTVRLTRAGLGSPNRLAFQVFLTAPGQKAVVDSSAPFQLDGQPPSRAPLLLAFYDSLPAASPAQLLRRWDGAHTGPNGGRHGLSLLLEAVEKTGVPITLLDLKTPAALSGAAVVGGLTQVGQLERKGRLVLPAAGLGGSPAAEESLSYSRRSAVQAGLPTGRLFYSPATGSGSPGCLSFQHALTDCKLSLASISGEDAAAASGLEVSMRAQLLNAALQGSRQLTLIGGSLPRSSWGNAVASYPTLLWIKEHPWIQPLGEQDLLMLLETGRQANSHDPAHPAPSSTVPQHAVQERLERLPAGQLRDLGWKVFLTLTQPAADEQLAQLRAAYLGQLEYILQAAGWLEQPQPVSTCTEDIDGDGELECILADARTFTVLKSSGGRLVFAGSLVGEQFEIWACPRSYLALGLSDPSTWQIDRGQLADPQATGDSFQEQADPYAPLQLEASPGAVHMRTPSGQLEKLFTLEQGRLTVEYRSQSSRQTLITLAPGASQVNIPGRLRQFSLDPQPEQIRFTAGKLILSVSLSLPPAQIKSSLETLSWMRLGEDPDREYPPGHFLPYPLTELIIQAPAGWKVVFTPE